MLGLTGCATGAGPALSGSVAEIAWRFVFRPGGRPSTSVFFARLFGWAPEENVGVVPALTTNRPLQREQASAAGCWSAGGEQQAIRREPLEKEQFVGVVDPDARATTVWLQFTLWLEPTTADSCRHLAARDTAVIYSAASSAARIPSFASGDGETLPVPWKWHAALQQQWPPDFIFPASHTAWHATQAFVHERSLQALCGQEPIRDLPPSASHCPPQTCLTLVHYSHESKRGFRERRGASPRRI